MIGYKGIIRLIANTEKNYFLLGDTQNIKKTKRKKIFKRHVNNIPNNKWIMTLLFQMMITQLKGCDNKYKYKIYKELLSNFLIVNSREETENFKNMFYKIQRVYYILNRFIYCIAIKLLSMMIGFLILPTTLASLSLFVIGNWLIFYKKEIQVYLILLES